MLNMNKHFLILVIFSAFFANYLYANSLQDLDYQEKLQADQYLKRLNDYKLLELSKYLLINGNAIKASHILTMIKSNKGRLKKIVDRYRSLIYFIQDDYEQSLLIYDRQMYGNISNIPNSLYREICTTRVISIIATGDNKRLQNEVNACIASTSEFSTNENYWIKAITNVSLNKNKNFNKIFKKNMLTGFYDNELILLWLKIAIYTNKEQLILPYLSSLPEKAYQSKRIRETIALIHFREKNFKRAYEFIEDINTPNAENIKGNLKLIENQKELALGHFKLALLKKPDSLNALERALPLSWQLKRWDEGERFIKESTLDFITKLALKSAFLIRKNEFESAKMLLDISRTLFSANIPIRLELMMGYLSSRKNNYQENIYYTTKLCQKNDGINCLLNMYTKMYNGVDHLVIREDNLNQTKEFSIEDLKLPVKIESFETESILSAKDIINI